MRPLALTLALAPVLALLAAAPVRGADFRVASRLEPREVGLGGHAYFTIEVEGPGFQHPRLSPRFELDNLEVVGRPDVSHGMTFGGGGSGWRYSWTWRLRPLEAGPATVFDVHLLVGDRAVELAPRSLEVLEEAPPGVGPPGPGALSPDGRSARRSRLEELLSRSPGRGRVQDRPAARDGGEEPALFLRAVAEPTRPYVGQRVLYTVYLYTRVPVRGMEPERLPTFRGLWAREVELHDAGAERVEWGDELYTRKAILRKQLFPLAAATHVVEPVRLRLLVERIERDRLFFSAVRVPVQVVRESNPVELDVRPLPPAPPDRLGRAELPAGFAGTVAALSLEADLEPAELDVGQGATLTVTATGEGHLEALAAPAVQVPDGLDLIGPQPAASRDGEDGASRRRWTYLLVPRRAGLWRLPALEVPYFDPGAGEYRLARAPVPDLVARLASGESTGAGAAAPPHTIRSAALPAAGGGSRSGWSRLRAALPWAFALPWVAALALILTRRGRQGRAGATGGGVRDLRRGLEAALREERPRRAAAGIERAWRGFLADSRGVPEAVPPASWPDELLARGARPEACRELRRLLEELHYLRFAPELSATASLAGELVRRSQRVARDLV